VLGLLDVPAESAVAERVTEVALVLLLFSDATRLDLGSLRHELGWPSRLLLIGRRHRVGRQRGGESRSLPAPRASQIRPAPT
jgi:hypothetical protein